MNAAQRKGPPVEAQCVAGWGPAINQPQPSGDVLPCNLILSRLTITNRGLLNRQGQQESLIQRSGSSTGAGSSPACMACL